MNWRNTDTKYGLLASSLHWIMAALVIGTLGIGLILEDLGKTPDALKIYALHKSLGVTVLALVVFRGVWRHISKPPASLVTHKNWEKKLAKIAHIVLYFCMIAMPLSGWIMSSAKGYSVSFFGLFDLPNFVPKDKGLSDTAKEIHEIVSNVLIGAIALHAAGALKHHFIDRDETLRRMLPFPLVAAILVPAFLMLTSPSAHSNSPMPVPQWIIQKDQSHLTFQGTQGGASFTGEFKVFDGSILFAPDDLANSNATIAIDTASAITGSDDRDSAIIGTDWFSSVVFPQAKFETTGFEKAEGDGRYIAHANLTIRDKTLPVDLPFTLKIEGDTATMDGTLTLNRLDFGVGQGEWKDTKAVGGDVIVKVALVAKKL
jgi:cytochrome b561